MLSLERLWELWQLRATLQGLLLNYALHRLLIFSYTLPAIIPICIILSDRVFGISLPSFSVEEFLHRSLTVNNS